VDVLVVLDEDEIEPTIKITEIAIHDKRLLHKIIFIYFN
jgi:hypothetical protein